jgi:hypothetical protein
MPLAEFDHLIVLAPHLAPEAARFTRAGFEVSSGGRFPPEVPFHNALIGFPNETYIELLGVQRPGARLVARGLSAIGLFELALRSRSERERRIGGLLGEPPGVADVCFRVPAIDGPALERESGVRWECSQMQRQTPSGELAQWQMAFPSDARLPFLIRDTTPRSRRIPSGASHANRVRHLTEIRLAMRDVAQAIPLYEWLLGPARREAGASAVWDSLGTRITLEEGAGRKPLAVRASMGPTVAAGSRAGAARPLSTGLVLE